MSAVSIENISLLFNHLATYQNQTLSCFLWDIYKLTLYYNERNEFQNTLDYLLQLFFKVTLSKYKGKQLKKKYKFNFNTITLKLIEELILTETIDFDDDPLNLWKILTRFVVIINIILFWRNQKNNHQMAIFTFMLNFRGLSNSGINILQQLSLSPSPKCLTEKKKLFISCFGKQPAQNVLKVFWYDNLYRSLKGFYYDRNQINVCYTVCSQTVILNSQPLIIEENGRGIVRLPNLFDKSLIREYKSLFRLFCFSPKYITQITNLTIPIRAQFNISLIYEFQPLDLLQFSPSDKTGTLKILQNLKEQFLGLNCNFYTFCTFDYDIYWRLHRLFYTKSLNPNSLRTAKKQLIIVLGPWHILWKFSSKMWKFYSPLFIAHLVFEYETKCSVNAPFPLQLQVWIALFKYRSTLIHQLKLLPPSNMQTVLLLLIEILVPLVFFFSVSSFIFYLYLFPGSGASFLHL